ncbi:hypothetical protein VTN02DRAFT_2689 [Thermoascus thermophilus]
MDPTSSTTSPSTPFPLFTTVVTSAPTETVETVEYEPYDTALAARVTSLYAQLESLTTTVAQLRRDAPKRAARGYADALRRALDEDDALLPDDEDEVDGDVGMTDADADADAEQQPKMEEDHHDHHRQRQRHRRPEKPLNPAWKLSLGPLSTGESERWASGEMGEVYNDALRTLLRLQGTAEDDDDGESGRRGDSVSEEGGAGGGGVKALATTVGKAERAARAAEVVEKM